MKSKKYYSAKTTLYLGKIGRKLASYGFPMFDYIYQVYIKTQIKSLYADIISQYSSIDYKPIPQTDNYPIWVFWWQGMDKMPEVVRMCYNSILRNVDKHPVNLITKYNYRKYLSNASWLDKILESLQSGNISYAYFSDIIRCCLLYTYGGMWIDATVLLTAPIDSIVNNRFFVTGRRETVSKKEYKKLPSPAKGRWTGYFVFSSKGNPLFKFINDILVDQILKIGYNTEYLMIDYCFVTAYENFPFVRMMQEKSPIYPNRISVLIENLNKEVNETWYKSLIKENPFLKLTYKRTWHEYTKNHKLTYYGYLKEKFL